MKNVLLIRSSENPAIQRFLDYAHQMEWRVQIADYTTNSVEAFRLDGACDYPDAQRLLRFWKPDGCVVQCGAAPLAYRKSDFDGTPTVFLDRDPETLEAGAHCVYSDAREIAEHAARELLRTGFDHFACVEFPDDLPWNVNRSRRFQEIVRLNGKSVTTYRLPRIRPYDLDANGLVGFLAALPRPVGIFTTNDAVGRQVLDACRRLAVAIPHEISIVSVDNVTDICERHYATLTSIERDIAASGQLAAQMLTQMMNGRHIAPTSCTYGVRRIVFRASAPGVMARDARLRTGLEYIRLHATDGIDVADVVRAMGCSRRLAYVLFERQCGYSILDAILRERLERARLLLSDTDFTVDTIAKMAGFEGACNFRRVFKRHFGKSPREWRAEQVRNRLP